MVGLWSIKKNFFPADTNHLWRISHSTDPLVRSRTTRSRFLQSEPPKSNPGQTEWVRSQKAQIKRGRSPCVSLLLGAINLTQRVPQSKLSYLTSVNQTFAGRTNSSPVNTLQQNGGRGWRAGMSHKLGSGPGITIKLSYLLTLPATHWLRTPLGNWAAAEAPSYFPRVRPWWPLQRSTLKKEEARGAFQLQPSDAIFVCVVGWLA